MNFRFALYPLCFRSLAFLIIVAFTSVSRASILTNGGFELPAQSVGAFITILPGAEPATFGWHVITGSVDLAHLPVNPFVTYAAAEGNQVLDLNGNERGAIYQDFATVIGQQYVLTFSFADNPIEAGISSADIDVIDVLGLTTLLHDTVSHSTSTNGPPAVADYTNYSSVFTAVGAFTRLSFTSTSASGSASGGIILDNVAVDLAGGGQVVPEPASVLVWSVLSLVFGGIGLRRHVRGMTVVS